MVRCLRRQRANRATCTLPIAGFGRDAGASATVEPTGRGSDVTEDEAEKLARKAVAKEFKKRVKKQKALEKEARKARKQNKRNKRAADM